MVDRLKFLVNRLQEKLWIKPLLMCVLSVFGVLLAKWFESTPIAGSVPIITVESVEVLLVTLSGSMLVVATFAVGSMVASLASAANNATPRTFPLIISDDISQNAIAIFIGAFIFGIVSIIFLKNEFFEEPGLFAILVLTALTFAVVILTFVRWIDSIARLGRLGSVIDKVVAVTGSSLEKRRLAPTLGAMPARPDTPPGRDIVSSSTGYVQRIDVKALQQCAKDAGVRIAVRALPGAFLTADRELARIIPDGGDPHAIDPDAIDKAFVIGDRRTFDEDPRFGLVVLSEIAARALSPAVNDPGTAIDVTGALVRLFSAWAKPLREDERKPCPYDRIEIPQLTALDMFDDAFTGIARDGAATVEVAARLQKALRTLASIDDHAIKNAAIQHSRLALARAAGALTLPQDLETIRALADFSTPSPRPR